MAQRDAADALDSATMATQFVGMVTGGWMSQAMYVTAELRIADILADGAKSSEELARTTGAHAPSLHRLMRTLVTFEILREREDGSFELMPMETFLRSDADHSLRSWAILCGRRLSRDWVGLPDSVKTGESVSKRITGRSFFEDLEREPQEAAVFNQAIAELTRLASGWSGCRVGFAPTGKAPPYHGARQKLPVDVTIEIAL